VTYRVVSWTGTLTNGDDECGGSASYTLDDSKDYFFTLAPDPANPGGCVVVGDLVLAQGPGLCTDLTGAWNCAGTVSPAGVMGVSCHCATGMPVGGQGTGGGTGEFGTFSGGWSFTLNGTSGVGTFLLDLP